MGESDKGRIYLERQIEAMQATTPGPSVEWSLTAPLIPMVNRITGDDDHSEVAEAAAQVVLASSSVLPVQASAARTALALLAVQQSDMAAAREQYAALESVRGTMLGTALDAIISADRLLGLLAQTMGKLGDAADHFEDAVAFCRKAGYRPELAWCCYEYAYMLVGARHDLPKDSSALLDESLAISTELGMRPLVEKVIVLQERLESQPAGALQYPDGLTRREVEVLRLIAAGKSNREIAEELFLSLRTIERHITNIYAKTNGRSKADATAYAFRHGMSS